MQPRLRPEVNDAKKQVKTDMVEDFEDPKKKQHVAGNDGSASIPRNQKCSREWVRPKRKCSNCDLQRKVKPELIDTSTERSGMTDICDCAAENVCIRKLPEM